MEIRIFKMLLIFVFLLNLVVLTKACTESELVEDPEDCTRYKECVNGEYLSRLCPAATGFSPTLKTCDHLYNLANCNPRSSNACTESELVEDAEDCTRYKECVNGEYLVRPCPAGTGFSPTLKTCDHLYNLANCNPGSSNACTESELVEDPEYCTRYKECVNGEYLSRPCPAGTGFSPTLKTCDHLYNLANCNPGSSNACTESELVEDPEDCTRYKECVNGEYLSRPCPAGTGFSPTLKTCDHLYNLASCNPGSSNACTESELVEDPEDCTRYKECVNGEYLSRPCPAGTGFSPTLKTCDHLYNLANCNPGSSNACTESELVEDPEYCTRYKECVNGDYLSRPCPAGTGFSPTLKTCDHLYNLANCNPGSSNACTESELVEDPEDCTRYKECVNGEYLSRLCPAATGFSPTLKTCDHLYKLANCNPRSSNACTESELVEDAEDCTRYKECVNGEYLARPCPAGTGFSPTLKTCDHLYNLANCNPGSNNACTESELVEDPEYCTRYKECVNGEYLSIPCPAGTGFSPTLKTCDHLYNLANCNPGSSNACTESELVEDPEDCTRYKECVNGEYLSRPCPVGTGFSPTLKTCDYLYNLANCNPGSSNACTESELVEDPEDCTQYKECVNGEYLSRLCPAGTGFSPTLKTCDHLYNLANCNPGSSNACTESELVEDPEDCTRYKECVNGEYLSRPCPVGTGFSPTLKTCDHLYNLANCNPGSSNACTESELLEDPEDCTRYKECVNGEYLSRPCPVGTGFSPTLKTCDHLYNLANCNPGSSNACTESELVEDPEDCTRYKECVNGEYLSRPCPAGTGFSPTLKTCDHLYNLANCNPGSINACTESELVEDAEDCTRYKECVNGEYLSRPCPVGTGFSPTLKTCDHLYNLANCNPGSSNACTESELVEDPEDCTRYKECVNGEHLSRPCPAGTGFSPTLKTCDHLYNLANCNPGSSNACTESELVEDPEDCTRYKECVNGEYLSRPCPAGTGFSPTLKTCDHLYNLANCNPGSSNACTESELVEDPEDCTRYKECVNGEYLSRPCPAGTGFSPTLKTCDHLYNLANCNPGSSNACTESELVEDPEDCTRYKECVNGEYLSRLCPAGTGFSPTLKTCDHLYNLANCNPGSNNACTESQLVEDPEDCTRYKECVNGEYLSRLCPAGTGFSPTLKTCDHLYNLANCNPGSNNACTESQLVEDPEDCTRYKECVNGEYLSRPCPIGTGFSPTLKTCDHLYNLANCNPGSSNACTESELVEDPEDCTQYKECVNGEYLSRPCPAGTGFSPTLKTCDHLYNLANCNP